MEREDTHEAEHAGAWLAVPSDLKDGQAPTALSERRAFLWGLVLEARAIPCRVEADGEGWKLCVPAERFIAARQELRLFEEENRHWPPPEPPARPLVENTLATLSVLILLATFHNLIQLDAALPGQIPPDWYALGSARAARIRSGEWWRLITALTLHSDWLHLASNLTIGGVFIVWLCRDLGSGLAWSLLLGAGTLGNLVNAWVQPLEHKSVGASTAVFGAVGILAAVSLVRHRQQLQRRWPLPVAAALALLALLGTEGKNTDLGAHLFGFLYGLALGVLAEYVTGRYGRPGRGVSALLALASAMAVVGAWWAALTYGR
ncbi:MAG TPA: rhomboid family intramembrane serine protease [Geobacteraceae bacterium]